MRRVALRFLIFTPLALGACEKEKETSAPPAASSHDPQPTLPTYARFEAGIPDAADESVLDFAALFGDIVPPPADFLVQITTSPCQASCVGDVKIDASGKTTIVKAGKKRELAMDPHNVSIIAARVRKDNYFALGGEYGSGAPTATISVTMNGQTKAIKHNLGDLLARAASKDKNTGLALGPERERLFEVMSQVNSLVTAADPETSFALPPELVRMFADAGIRFDAARD